eukprot:GFUD01005570.1.p1 GENE.GFUD01005570.1~~GFUD01005570.1.p1  ORF type:complete len:182 (-),score=32.36 GFUD01005570.1:14-559(-)
MIIIKPEIIFEDQTNNNQGKEEFGFHFLASFNTTESFNETEYICSETITDTKSNEKGNFECTVCSFGSKYSRNLKKHIFSKHSEIESGLSLGSRHKCHLCDRRYYDTRHLQNHINSSHYNVRPFSCKVCEKRFFQQVHVQVHMKTHSNEKDHVCKLCDKQFRLAHHLRRHLSKCQSLNKCV